MDLKQYEQGAVETKTTPPQALTAGYPTNGDPATGAQATSPGAYWYYQIQAELDNLLKKAGLTPDHEKLTQLYEGINKLAINQAINQATPVGGIFIWPDSTPPTGALECDGSALSRTTYAALFAELGTAHGTGAGTTASTTFRVPDLRGEFVRGWDHGRGADSGRTIGNKQKATRVYRRNYFNPGGWGNGMYDRDHLISADYNGSVEAISSGTTSRSGSASHNHSYGILEGIRVRPRNVALMYVIKY